MFNSNKINEKKLVTVKKLYAVDGYESGVGERPIIFLSKDLYLAEMSYGKKNDKRIAVRAMIVTANANTEVRKFITENYPDATGLALGKVIIVSKQFEKLSKKQQIALLEVEYRKQLKFDDANKNWKKSSTVAQATNLDREISASLDVSEIYGSRVVKSAVAKKERLLRKDEASLGRKLHRIYKKDEKLLKKVKDDFQIDDENVDVDIMDLDPVQA